MSVPPDLSTRLTSHSVALFSITAEHAEAIRLGSPSWDGATPFDRVLIAQELRLLSADHILLDLGRNFVIDAAR